jgi:uncharacterized membrane protein YphA (DoxX/SURF4 family)
MLSIFPSLLIFGILAPFILRIVVGVYFLHAGYQDLGKEREKTVEELAQSLGTFAKPALIFGGIFEIVIGLSLITGFLTQLMALFGMIYVLKFLSLKKQYPSLIKHERVFYVMVFVILFSLLLTGAGAFAIDLPL